jgi:glycosyltransferase involved in cell wall biosynthesis
MRVLFWSELFWPYIGGAEVFGAGLVAALRRRGHDLAVVTSHDQMDLPDEGRYEGVPVYHFPFRAAIAGRDLGLFREALRGAARLKSDFAPDLIHANGVGPSLIFHLRTAAASRARLLVTLQQEVLTAQAGGTLLEQALRAADWVTGCSAAALSQARALLPEISSRSSLIYNSVEAPGVLPAPPPACPRLLCLGRLVPAKGFDLALSAFALLRGRFPDARLLVAGDGPMRDELQRQAAALKVEDAVDFLGWVSPGEVFEVINRSTLVLMPSRREGLPLAAIQAAMMGRPVVASGAGGLAEVVAHGVSGFVLDVCDAPTLAGAIARLLCRPEELRRMGVAARLRALDLFAWDKSVAEFEDLYRRLNGDLVDEHARQASPGG